jgi:hypothetical protein
VAEITSYTAAKILELLGPAVVGVDVDGSNQLVLTTQAGDTVNGGVIPGVAAATTTASGVVELATSTEATTGTDTSRAVTPAAAKAAVDAAISAANTALVASLVASATAKGLVELATDTEATTGTDTTRAITPANLAAVRALLQPLDSDLTAIAGLSATDNDIIQRKSGAWINRTMAQLATDIAASGEFPNLLQLSGGTYVDVDGGNIYMGSSDPGVVPNGSIWFTI